MIKSKCFFFSMIFLYAQMLYGCNIYHEKENSIKYADDKDLSKIVFFLSSAKAFNCKEFCSNIDLKYKIYNNENFDICLSSLYKSDIVMNYIYLSHIYSDDSLDGYEVTPRVTFANPDVPGDELQHAEWLFSHQNIIIRSYSSKEFEVSTNKHFAIPKAPFNAHLSVYLYPCNRTLFNKIGFLRKTSKIKLEF